MSELRERAVEARHAGRCGLCQEPIQEGDWIVNYEESWVHLGCAEPEDG